MLKEVNTPVFVAVGLIVILPPLQIVEADAVIEDVAVGITVIVETFDTTGEHEPLVKRTR